MRLKFSCSWSDSFTIDMTIWDRNVGNLGVMYACEVLAMLVCNSFNKGIGGSQIIPLILVLGLLYEE
jgi:hypothetical protein